MGASLFWRCSGQTNRLTPHPSPLPLRGGEGESLAVRPRRWRRKSSNDQVLAIAEPTAPPDSLSPSEGERAGVRGAERIRLHTFEMSLTRSILALCAFQKLRCISAHGAPIRS